MTLVPTGTLVHPGGCVGAFNVITLEHAEAIVAGAEDADRPVILQVSQNAVRFHGGALAALAAGAASVARSARVEVALHLDHVTDLRLLYQAAEHQFGSVMADFSHLSYVDNVTATADAVRYAHRHGLWLESELGTIGGKDGEPPLSPHAPGARTDPSTAVAFVASTGIDALAVAVGSAHAMTRQEATLDHDLIVALHDAVPVPLVLHGSSGVPDDELRRAVAEGIAKVNVGTALNVAFTRAIRDQLAVDPSVVDPRRYLSVARRAMAGMVTHVLHLLSAG